MSKEIEEKIKMLADIRHGVGIETYLNQFRAREHITFLLALIDELTDALFKIHKAIQEIRKNDPNIDHANEQSTDPLPS